MGNSNLLFINFFVTLNELSTANAAYHPHKTNLSIFLALTDELDSHHRLQQALSTCNPANGVCAIEWLNEDCLVQTYFAEQLGPTDCPDAPCPPDDLTCSVLNPSTCDDCSSD